MALELSVANGEAMHCPSCEIIIFRTEGCSYLTCGNCKLEICWATKGPRWGLKGKNDLSGGCKCDWFYQSKCHPDCTY